MAIELHSGPDTDDEELSELAGRLRGELLDLEVEAVQFSSDTDLVFRCWTASSPMVHRSDGLIVQGAL